MLVYACALGLAFYALLGVVVGFHSGDARAWFDPGAPTRLVGGFAILLGVTFSVLWLSEVSPALVSGGGKKPEGDGRRRR